MPCYLRFIRTATHFAKGDVDYFRKVFDGIATKLKVTDWKDWYSVSQSDITENGGKRILQLFGNNIPKALETIYPGTYKGF